MNYFGTLGPPELKRSPTPVGQPCLHCGEAIEAEASGYLMPVLEGEDGAPVIRPIHRECQLRMVFGSLGHLMGLCSCNGGIVEDPPGLTKREAARAAVEHLERVGFQPAVRA